MGSLEKIKCPFCGEYLIARVGEVKPASSYQDCLRECKKCMIRYSNASKNPTLIYHKYSDNVPMLLRPGLDNVLNNSINSINRISKKNKFAFSTSEDALTWSFFKYFVFKNKLKDLLKLLEIDSEDLKYDIYLWGTNICSTAIDDNFHNKFIQISDSFNEDPSRRTEPDVILKLSKQLIFIEVKYLSANEVFEDKSKFNKYLIPNLDNAKLFESGHYELFRNWVFASKLCGEKKYKLINLGLKKLFTDKNADKLLHFEKSLNSENGNFTKLSWEQILNKLDEGEYDNWFVEYLNQKIYTPTRKLSSKT